MFLYYSYRTREEIQEVRQTRDPITSFKQKILEADLATEDELKVNIFKVLYLSNLYMCSCLICKCVHVCAVNVFMYFL
jgi:hypothetical protein